MKATISKMSMIPRTTISTMVAPRTALSRSSSFRQACKVVKLHSVARRWGPRIRKLFGFVFVSQPELGRGSGALTGAKGGRVSGFQLGPDSGVSGPDVYIWGRIPAQIWGRIPAQIRAGCRPRLGAGFRPRVGRMLYFRNRFRPRFEAGFRPRFKAGFRIIWAGFRPKFKAGFRPRFEAGFRPPKSNYNCVGRIPAQI